MTRKKKGWKERKEEEKGKKEKEEGEKKKKEESDSGSISTFCLNMLNLAS